MTTADWIRSCIELVLVASVIFGLLFEEKIADAEEKLFNKIKKAVKNIEAN